MVNHRSSNITLQWKVHFLIWQTKAEQHPVDGSQLLRCNWKPNGISLITLHHSNENKGTQASKAKTSDQKESSSESCLLRSAGTTLFHKMLHRSWCSVCPIKEDSKWGGTVGPAAKLGSRDTPVSTLGKMPSVSAYLLLVNGWSCSFVLVDFQFHFFLLLVEMWNS